MNAVKTPSVALTRDQRRALHAYDAVASVEKEGQKDYKIAINDLGANILRSGLCAALAALQRNKAGKQVLAHLAKAQVPGLEQATGENLPGRVRELKVEAYMIATRETLQVALWLKRAVQASFGET